MNATLEKFILHMEKKKLAHELHFYRLKKRADDFDNNTEKQRTQALMTGLTVSARIHELTALIAEAKELL